MKSLNSHKNRKKVINQPTVACLVCSNEFIYRKNKTYCSNACKQRAYLANKSGLSLDSQPQRISTDFSLSEYLTYRNEFDKDMSVVVFFFLRRHLPKKATIEQIRDYINGFCDFDFWDNLHSAPAYKRFVEEYLDNKYSVGA